MIAWVFLRPVHRVDVFFTQDCSVCKENSLGHFYSFLVLILAVGFVVKSNMALLKVYTEQDLLAVELQDFF